MLSAICQAAVPEGYEWAVAENDEGWVALHDIDRHIENDSWPVPSMELLTRERGLRRSLHADMPWCNRGVLVLRDSAIEAVGPLLAPFGVFRPVACRIAELMVFRAAALPGVLDVENSEIVWFDSSDRIMSLENAQFHRDLVPDIGAFRVQERHSGPTFLTRTLVDLIRATGRTSGTVFKPL